jgi:hypothetical protein
MAVLDVVCCTVDILEPIVSDAEDVEIPSMYAGTPAAVMDEYVGLRPVQDWAKFDESFKRISFVLAPATEQPNSLPSRLSAQQNRGKCPGFLKPNCNKSQISIVSIAPIQQASLRGFGPIVPILVFQGQKKGWDAHKLQGLDANLSFGAKKPVHQLSWRWRTDMREVWKAAVLGRNAIGGAILLSGRVALQSAKASRKGDKSYLA